MVKAKLQQNKMTKSGCSCITTPTLLELCCICPHEADQLLPLYCTLQDIKSVKFCPVGKVLPGVHVVILDDDLKPQPVGVPGEVGCKDREFCSMQ